MLGAVANDADRVKYKIIQFRRRMHEKTFEPNETEI